jgi:HK97 family phage portal protein
MMKWLKNLSFKSASPRVRSFDEIMDLLDGGIAGSSFYGSNLSSNEALRVSTVLACVRVIADGCATPELMIFEENSNERRKKAINDPAYRLLNRRPNPWQTSFEFRRLMTMHAALTGAGLAVKVKVGRIVKELIPVRPGTYQVDITKDYEQIFRVNDAYGPVGDFKSEDVFYLPNLQWQYHKTLDGLSLAREAVGLSIAAEASQAALYRNGGRPSGILTTQQSLSPEAVDRLRVAWKKFTENDRHGTAILDSGTAYAPIQMSSVDNQTVETRRFQIEEICRAFGVAPIMVGHSDKTSTFASSEAFFAAHVKHTLAPWHALWTQRIDEFLLDGAGPLWAEFDTRYLLAGSMADRATWARTMAELGIYTRNELREEEGKDPLPGLDEPLTPLNMKDGQKNANA